MISTAYLFLHLAVRPISERTVAHRFDLWLKRFWPKAIGITKPTAADAEAKRDTVLLTREEPWVLAQKDPFSECGVRKD